MAIDRQKIFKKVPSKMQKLFGNMLFDVEHALSMYATSYCIIPASGIYDTSILEHFKHIIESCHIYLIGTLPAIDFLKAVQIDRQLYVTLSALGRQFELSFPLPIGVNLRHDKEAYFLEDLKGNRSWINELEMIRRLNVESNLHNFKVKYIGQSYGRDGSRNAIDRLLRHETLQKISLRGIPEGFCLSILLLEIQVNNQIFTVFNPHAQNKDDDGVRIRAGIDKLFGTNEHERITLYEASLIRYFSPEYNIEFKNSFPSTNLKVLKDCYKKDFFAVVAEICIDDLPFRIYSESVEPAIHHFAKHDLHDDIKRKAFFFGNDKSMGA